jgi:hypothetical protein
MPVFFYLDPDLLNDMNMKGVETVTLSYTFFSTLACENGNDNADILNRSKIRQQRTVPEAYVEIGGTFVYLIKCTLCPSTSKIRLLRSRADIRHMQCND